MVQLCEVLLRCAASMANLECFDGHSHTNTPLHKKTLLNRWLRKAFSDPGRTADPTSFFVGEQEHQERELEGEVVGPSAWHTIYNSLLSKALEGNVSAAKLVIERRFGLKPKEETSSPTSVKPPTWFMPSSQD